MGQKHITRPRRLEKKGVNCDCSIHGINIRSSVLHDTDRDNGYMQTTD